jgi:phage FluMu protein Com
MGTTSKKRHDCATEKRRYADRIEAELAADVIGLPFVYRCTHCKGWHLTRQDPRTRTVNGLTRTQKRSQVRKRARERQRDLGDAGQ